MVMISRGTLAIGKGPAMGAASAIAGVSSNAAQATASMIFRIEVSPFQAGTPGDALDDAQAVLLPIYASLPRRRSKEIFTQADGIKSSWRPPRIAACQGNSINACDAGTSCAPDLTRVRSKSRADPTQKRAEVWGTSVGSHHITYHPFG
jgi:hypothetical protein